MMDKQKLLAYAKKLYSEGDQMSGILYMAVLALDTIPEDVLPAGSTEEGEFKFALEGMITSGIDMIRLYNKVVKTSEIPEFEYDITTH